MKEKWFRCCLSLGLGLTLLFPNLAFAAPTDAPSPGSDMRPAATDHHHMVQCTQPVKLTESQKKELQQLFVRLNIDNKQLIDAYAKMGIITKEAQQRKLNMMEKFMQNLLANQFVSCIKVHPGGMGYMIPGKGKHHHHWHNHKENNQS